MATERKPIPLAILKPIANDPWLCDDYALDKFATTVEWHRERDNRDGLTCAYFLGERRLYTGLDILTGNEFEAIVEAGAIDPEFHNGHGVNQHWLHSLEQFYAEVEVAYQKHQERTKALIGTPAGRIYRE